MIDKIYDNVIDYVIENVPEEYVEEVKKAYHEHLVKIYSSFVTEDNEKLTNHYISLEKAKYGNVNDVLMRFVNDEHLNTITKIANTVRNDAIGRVNGKEIDIDYIKKSSEYIESLNDNLPLVKEFNKKYAEQLISDAMLDINYASGISDDVSLPVSHIIKSK